MPVFLLDSISDTNFSSIDSEYTNLTNIRDTTTHTDNKKISLSSMLNYGNTCWLNSSLKFIYSFYGYHELKIAIQNKLYDVKKQPSIELQQKLKQLLYSFSKILDAMLANENINIQIITFLTSLHEYTQALPLEHLDKERLDYANVRIIHAFNDGNIDVSKIRQQDANEFIQPFLEFLNLNTEYCTLTKKISRKYTFTKENLTKSNIY